MSRDVVDQKNENPVAKYDGDHDGFELVAQGDRVGIVGTRLKFIKGEWIAGSDEEIVPLGTRFLFDMGSLHVGYILWESGVPVDGAVVRVADNVPIPQRHTLGDLDKSAWPEGIDGGKKDPWSPDARARMVALDEPHEEFTFVSSSWGGRFAVQKLCRIYVADRGEHPGEMPIIAIGAYKRPDKKFGKIDSPVLEVVGWAALDEVLNGGLAPKKAKAPKPSSRPGKASKKQSIEAQIAALEAQLDEEGEDEALFREEAE